MELTNNVFSETWIAFAVWVSLLILTRSIINLGLDIKSNGGIGGAIVLYRERIKQFFCLHDWKTDIRGERPHQTCSKCGKVKF